MKKIHFITLLLGLMFTGFVSCTKDGNIVTPATVTTSFVIVQGTWKITYVTDNGIDRTADFSGFTFSFGSGGSVAASNTLLAVNGTWSSFNDDSQNKLLLNFPNTLSFAILNHDWHLLERSSVKIRMEDVSGGGGATDFLTIEKI